MMANAILVAVDGPHAGEWVDLFYAQTGARDVHFWPDDLGDPAAIGYACVWRPPAGLLSMLPNLKLIFNLGAGADHLLSDPLLPSVPIVRAAHPDLSMRVTEYVVLHSCVITAASLCTMRSSATACGMFIRSPRQARWLSA
jgi:glyoxylate/hydroxypyruvate reductase